MLKHINTFIIFLIYISSQYALSMDLNKDKSPYTVIKKIPSDTEIIVKNNVIAIASPYRFELFNLQEKRTIHENILKYPVLHSMAFNVDGNLLAHVTHNDGSEINHITIYNTSSGDVTFSKKQDCKKRASVAFNPLYNNEILLYEANIVNGQYDSRLTMQHLDLPNKSITMQFAPSYRNEKFCNQRQILKSHPGNPRLAITLDNIWKFIDSHCFSYDKLLAMNQALTQHLVPEIKKTIISLLMQKLIRSKPIIPSILFNRCETHVTEFTASGNGIALISSFSKEFIVTSYINAYSIAIKSLNKQNKESQMTEGSSLMSGNLHPNGNILATISLHFKDMHFKPCFSLLYTHTMQPIHKDENAIWLRDLMLTDEIVPILAFNSAGTHLYVATNKELIEIPISEFINHNITSS